MRAVKQLKTEVPSPGRPRSTDATERVRAAALELAYEGGVSHATVDRISARSGVAKTTIYRRWANAGSVVMDAYLAEIEPLIGYRHKDGLKATFSASARRLVRAINGPRGELLKHLIGAAQTDPQLQAAFWDHWIGPRRQQAKALIDEAARAGEITGVDADVLVDEIFGAIYYRLLIPYEALTTEYVDRLVNQVFRGVNRDSGSQHNSD